MEQLRRSITLYGLTLVVIGSCVGSGIFLTPSIITAQLDSPLLVLFAWIIGGVIAISGALTFAELSSALPDAGGLYAHLRKAYGDWAGFLYGWSYLVVVVSGAIAALCIACANYMSYILPLDELGQILFAIAAVILISIVNIFGVAFGDLFSNLFTTAKLIGISLLVILGFAYGHSELNDFSYLLPDIDPAESSGSNYTVFGAALIGVVFSYGGFQHASFLTGETIDPKRNVPLAMVIGASIVTVVYLLTNAAYFYLLPMDEISNSTTLAADAMGTVWSEAGIFIAVLIAVSTLGTAGIYTLSAPRLYHAMAVDGLFWKNISKVHSKYKTPYKAIILQAVWAIVLILFWRTFENLITYIVFVDWIFLTMAAYAIFIFRKKLRIESGSYKAFGYPLTPWIFIVISLYIIVSTIVSQPLHAVIGIGFLALGVLMYFIFFKSKQ